MHDETTERLFAKAISQIIEVAEAVYGTDAENKTKWEFYRTSLLKRLNELKRDIQKNGIRLTGGQHGNPQQ